MENLDVWSVILSKLDNSTLGLLFLSGFQEYIKSLYEKNSFWKARTEHLASRSLATQVPTDWRRVYYSVLASQASVINPQGALKTLSNFDKEKIGPWFYGLDYLPSLLVLIDIYGKPSWSHNDGEQRRIWRNILDPEVIHFLLDSHFLLTEDRDESAISGLENAAYYGYSWMIDPILSAIAPERRTTAASLALYHAISGGNLTIVKLLLTKPDVAYSLNPDNNLTWTHIAKHATKEVSEYLLSISQPQDWMSTAITAELHDNAEALSVLITRGRLKKEQLQQLWTAACNDKSPSVLVLLDELDPSLKGKIKYGSLLTYALKIDMRIRQSSKLKLIRYLITKVNPATANNQYLKPAVKEEDPEAVAALLSDPRIDPNVGLSEMLEDNRKRGRSTEALDVVILDPRVRVETMSVTITDSILHSFSSTLRDRLLGFGGQGQFALGSEKVLYYLIARYLIIKRPSREKLADWLIGRHDRRIKESAALVIENETTDNPEIAPIRALLLCLLYPTMSYKEQIAALISEGMNGELLDRCAHLLGAYFGKKTMGSE